MLVPRDGPRPSPRRLSGDGAERPSTPGCRTGEADHEHGVPVATRSRRCRPLGYWFRGRGGARGVARCTFAFIVEGSDAGIGILDARQLIRKRRALDLTAAASSSNSWRCRRHPVDTMQTRRKGSHQRSLSRRCAATMYVCPLVRHGSVRYSRADHVLALGGSAHGGINASLGRSRGLQRRRCTAAGGVRKEDLCGDQSNSRRRPRRSATSTRSPRARWSPRSASSR